MQNEQWKPVVGFENHYIVSNLGRIKRTSFTRRSDVPYLKGGIRSTGYKYITFTVGNKTYQRALHRIIGECFIPNPERRPQINHIDGNKLNNAIHNLEWVTARGNLLHRSRILGKERGENHHAASLTEKQVLHVISLMREGYRNIDISRITGIYSRKVSLIRHRGIWAHLPR